MLYEITGISSPWWMCGPEVPHGITGHLGRDDTGILQLERPGPAIPSFTIPRLNRLIVTEQIRSELETEFSHLEFQNVNYANVVPLNWHEWDSQAPMPEKEQNYHMPAYIMDADEFDDMLIEEMPAIFELVPKNEIELELVDGGLRFTEEPVADADFFDGVYINGNPHIRSVVISDCAKEWIESRQSEWLEYERLQMSADSA